MGFYWGTPYPWTPSVGIKDSLRGNVNATKSTPEQGGSAVFCRLARLVLQVVQKLLRTHFVNGRRSALRIDGRLSGNGWLVMGTLKSLRLIQRSATRQNQSKNERHPCIAYAHRFKELKTTIQNFLISIRIHTLKGFSAVRQSPFLGQVERMTSYIPDQTQA